MIWEGFFSGEMRIVGCKEEKAYGCRGEMGEMAQRAKASNPGT